MPLHRTVTCTEIQRKQNMILIKYKFNRHINIMCTFPTDSDFQIAQTLTPGDKFVLEFRYEKIGPTAKFDIPEQTCFLEYIVRKIKQR